MSNVIPLRPITAKIHKLAEFGNWIPRICGMRPVYPNTAEEDLNAQLAFEQLETELKNRLSQCRADGNENRAYQYADILDGIQRERKVLTAMENDNG